MDELKQIITNRLKAAREEVGFTQAELAELLGLARQSYTHIETGRNMLGIENLVKLPKVLGKPINYFAGMDAGDLTSDESELLELYRALPPGDLKENTLIILRATAQQARAAEPEKPSTREMLQRIREMPPEERGALSDLIVGLGQDDENTSSVGGELSAGSGV